MSDGAGATQYHWQPQPQLGTPEGGGRSGFRKRCCGIVFTPCIVATIVFVVGIALAGLFVTLACVSKCSMAVQRQARAELPSTAGLPLVPAFRPIAAHAAAETPAAAREDERAATKLPPGGASLHGDKGAEAGAPAPSHKSAPLAPRQRVISLSAACVPAHNAAELAVILGY